MNHKRWLQWTLALGLALILVTAGGGEAANDTEMMGKEVTKIAEALEKKQAMDAEQQVRLLVKKWKLSAKPMNGLDDLHRLFALRRKGGFGVGTKPRSVWPDGIELKLQALSEGQWTAKQLEAEAASLNQMAFRTAGIAELTLAALPAGLRGQNTVWEEMSMEMRHFALALAEAVQKKDQTGVRQAAQALDATCTKCHARFRPGGFNPFIPRPKAK